MTLCMGLHFVGEVTTDGICVCGMPHRLGCDATLVLWRRRSDLQGLPHLAAISVVHQPDCPQQWAAVGLAGVPAGGLSFRLVRHATLILSFIRALYHNANYYFVCYYDVIMTVLLLLTAIFVACRNSEFSTAVFTMPGGPLWINTDAHWDAGCAAYVMVAVMDAASGTVR